MSYNILKKLFIILFIILFFIIKYTPISLCSELDEIISGGDSFIDASSTESVKLSTSGIKNVSDSIYNILLGLGIILAVIYATILGVQYITAAAEDKAQIKESMIPFIIGCIVVFGAFAIWKAVILAFK